MRRHTDVISSLFVSLACVVAVLCVASYWWYGQWVVSRTATHDIRLLSNRGGFALQRSDPPGADGLRTVYPAIVHVHYSALVVLLLVVPAVRVVVRRRVASGRRRAGACETCGYDLRASADRCPECGTPAATTAA